MSGSCECGQHLAPGEVARGEVAAGVTADHDGRWNVHTPDLFLRAYSDRDWRAYKWLLAECVTYGPPGRILDLGAGLGHFVECCARFGIECVGLEGSEWAVQGARARYEMDIRHHYLDEPLPFEDGSFGAVVCNQLLGHLLPHVAASGDCHSAFAITLQQEGVGGPYARQSPLGPRTATRIARRGLRRPGGVEPAKDGAGSKFGGQSSGAPRMASVAGRLAQRERELHRAQAPWGRSTWKRGGSRHLGLPKTAMPLSPGLKPSVASIHRGACGPGAQT